MADRIESRGYFIREEIRVNRETGKDYLFIYDDLQMFVERFDTS